MLMKEEKDFLFDAPLRLTSRQLAMEKSWAGGGGSRGVVRGKRNNGEAET